MLVGCNLLPPRFVNPSQNGQPMVMQNPLFIPVSETDFAWHQLVDMMDDYFEIASEQPVREVQGTLLEGRITSKPLVGATFLEPLRRDSSGLYERLHSTFQSTRRTAHMRIVPVANGYQIQLEVLKELEDVSQPEYSTVTSTVRRHDGSLVTPRLNDRDYEGPATLGWIALGRDEALEQAMLRNLHARMFETADALPPAGNELY
jgi:hypothetical protein